MQPWTREEKKVLRVIELIFYIPFLVWLFLELWNFQNPAPHQDESWSYESTYESTRAITASTGDAFERTAVWLSEVFPSARTLDEFLSPEGGMITKRVETNVPYDPSGPNFFQRSLTVQYTIIIRIDNQSLRATLTDSDILRDYETQEQGLTDGFHWGITPQEQEGLMAHMVSVVDELVLYINGNPPAE